MTRSAVAIALFPPLAPAHPDIGSEFDRGFDAGRMSAESAAAVALAALRLAFDTAQAEAEAASQLVRDEMIEATRRLIVACAPQLAARATLEALSEVLGAAINGQGAVTISVAPDIAEAVRALASDAAVEVDPSAPVGSASVRWRHGGLDSSPMRAIESVIELINQQSCNGAET